MRISVNVLPKEDNRVNIVISHKVNKTEGWKKLKVLSVEDDGQEIKIYNLCNDKTKDKEEI